MNFAELGIKAVRADNLRALPRGGRRAQPPVSPPAPDGNVLTPGVAVLLDNLIGAAQLNGTAGLLRRFDAEVQRWHVELPDGELKAVKIENIRVQGRGLPSPR